MNKSDRALTEADFAEIAPLIAAELAAQLLPAADVFNRFGFSAGQAAALLESPTFREMVRDANQTWASPEHTPDRIRIKSMLALEEMIAPHFAMGIDKETSPLARNEIMKTFERLSGINGGKDGSGVGGSGEKFSVTINLGEQRSVTVSGPAVEYDDAP